MAEFPLEPNLAKLLIMSVDLGCSKEVRTVSSWKGSSRIGFTRQRGFPPNVLRWLNVN